MRIFIDPVTTGCGHTFCRRCLRNVLDHSALRKSGQVCPLCRAPIHIAAEHQPVTVALQSLLLSRCSVEVEARRAELNVASGEASSSSTSLPVFVLTTATLPGQPVFLNVFEPRYRLMIRRCLEGSRLFVLADPLPFHSVDSTYAHLPNFAVLVRIVECAVQPDGRYHVAGVATVPVALDVAATSPCDGYLVTPVAPIVPTTMTKTEHDDAIAMLRSIAQSGMVPVSVQDAVLVEHSDDGEVLFWRLASMARVEPGTFLQQLLGEPSLLKRTSILRDELQRRAAEPFFRRCAVM